MSTPTQPSDCTAVEESPSNKKESIQEELERPPEEGGGFATIKEASPTPVVKASIKIEGITKNDLMEDPPYGNGKFSNVRSNAIQAIAIEKIKRRYQFNGKRFRFRTRKRRYEMKMKRFLY